MKVTFDSATLADDTASPRLAGIVERLGMSDVVQTEQLYAGANLAKFPRGNVGGQFVFTVGCSYASYDAAATAFKTALALLDAQATCVFTPTGSSTVDLTFANAILHDVTQVEWQGVWLKLRYTFEITTIS